MLAMSGLTLAVSFLLVWILACWAWEAVQAYWTSVFPPLAADATPMEVRDDMDAWNARRECCVLSVAFVGYFIVQHHVLGRDPCPKKSLNLMLLYGGALLWIVSHMNSAHLEARAQIAVQ